MDEFKKVIKEIRPSLWGLPIPEISFNNVVKHPITYALILMSLTCGFFIHEFVGSSNDREKDCQTEINYWKGAYTTERNINLQITNVLLNEKLGFNQYKDSTARSDSITRQKLLPKSLKIIKP